VNNIPSSPHPPRSDPLDRKMGQVGLTFIIISSFITVSTSAYLSDAKTDASPIVVIPCLIASATTLALGILAFRMAERMREGEDEEKNIYRRGD